MSDGRRFYYAMIDAGGLVEHGGCCVSDSAEAIRTTVQPGLTLVELNEAQFHALRNGRHRFVDGVLERVVLPVDLPKLRREAIAHIDAAAERARAPFLTHGAGQAMEYQATLEEAREYRAGYDAHLYPWLQAEVEAQEEAGGSLTMAEVAGRVLGRAAAWEAAGVAIKRLRRSAKLRVEQATTPDEIAAAATSIPWPQP